MADEKAVDETTTQDNDQDVSDFLGVDAIYMNYSDERNKPFRAEQDDEAEGPQDNAEVLSTEEVAYANQEWTREDAGQDPKTGEPLGIDPAEQLKRKRAQYADPNWQPNVPSPMTAPAQSEPAAVSNETDAEFEARKAEAQKSDTGSTEQVNADGTTGDEKTSTASVSDTGNTTSTTTAPVAPAAPRAAKKTASSSDNK